MLAATAVPKDAKHFNSNIIKSKVCECVCMLVTFFAHTAVSIFMKFVMEIADSMEHRLFTRLPQKDDNVCVAMIHIQTGKAMRKS